MLVRIQSSLQGHKYALYIFQWADFGCETKLLFKVEVIWVLRRICSTATESLNLPEILQSIPTINRNFSLTKNSSQRETISYICGLRARIECEPFSEHSTRSDRVTNIGYGLPLRASVLSPTNYYFCNNFSVSASS